MLYIPCYFKMTMLYQNTIYKYRKKTETNITSLVITMKLSNISFAIIVACLDDTTLLFRYTKIDM